MRGDLAVVEHWLAAVNEADEAAVLALSASDVEIVGPRGSGHGRDLLAGWMARAGFRSESRRWFCGEDGRVVVELDAAWSTAPHAEPSRARVASAFVVRDQKVARFQRFETTDAALAAAGLCGSDEVSERS